MEKTNFYYNNYDVTEKIMSNLEHCINMIKFSTTANEEEIKKFFFSITFHKCLIPENEMWLLSPYEIWDQYSKEPKTCIIINNQNVTELVREEFEKTIDKIVDKYKYSILEAACIVRTSEVYAFLNEVPNIKKRKKH